MEYRDYIMSPIGTRWGSIYTDTFASSARYSRLRAVMEKHIREYKEDVYNLVVDGKELSAGLPAAKAESLRKVLEEFDNGN